MMTVLVVVLVLMGLGLTLAGIEILNLRSRLEVRRKEAFRMYEKLESAHQRVVELEKAKRR